MGPLLNAPHHRADAELLEEYCINFYHTEDYYNIAKTNKGNVSFLGDCEQFPWHEYSAEENIINENFVIDPNSKVTEKIIEVKQYISVPTPSIAIDDFWRKEAECRDYVNNEILAEKEICISLKWLFKHPETSKVSKHQLIKGHRLHQNRLSLLESFSAEMNKGPFHRTLLSYFTSFQLINQRIKSFENTLREETNYAET